MKPIFSMTIVALFSTALAGCWFYSRPDSSTGCQKTTSGTLASATTTENCPPANAGSAAPPITAPPIPPPSLM